MWWPLRRQAAFRGPRGDLPAAVAAAVRAATGRPINRLPIRPQAAVAAAKS